MIYLTLMKINYVHLLPLELLLLLGLLREESAGGS